MPQISDLAGKSYVAVVQCHIVMERCPGFFCERSFINRTGGFATLDTQRMPRVIYLTCGGCCGRAVHRKLALLVRKAEQADHLAREQIVVKFATCITRDNYHGPQCPHLAYLVKLVDRLKLDYSFDTHVADLSQKRREEGVYES